MLSQILYALPFLAKGFALTLWVSLLVVTLSLIAGVVLGVGLVYGPAPLRWALRIFSDTIRGIPILVLMFFVYYGLPAIGLWARVPHYTAGMPYPAASAALLDGLARVSGLEIDARDLHAAAVVTSQRIDELIAGNAEHAEMVRQLEAQTDEQTAAAPIDAGNLPSGDELAAELERFLRGQR